MANVSVFAGVCCVDGPQVLFYTFTLLLLSGRQISWAKFTDKAVLSYKQCYMKRFLKSCMTFQSLLPCHFSGWHFWWDGKTLKCTMWLKGLALSLIQNITLSPFTTVDELKMKSKLKTPFTINLLMDGRCFVCHNMRQFHYDWKKSKFNQTKVSQTDIFCIQTVWFN